MVLCLFWVSRLPIGHFCRPYVSSAGPRALGRDVSTWTDVGREMRLCTLTVACTAPFPPRRHTLEYIRLSMLSCVFRLLRWCSFGIRHSFDLCVIFVRVLTTCFCPFLLLLLQLAAFRRVSAAWLVFPRGFWLFLFVCCACGCVVFYMSASCVSGGQFWWFSAAFRSVRPCTASFVFSCTAFFLRKVHVPDHYVCSLYHP
jgi:hypothetical protein